MKCIRGHEILRIKRIHFARVRKVIRKMAISVERPMYSIVRALPMQKQKETTLSEISS